MKDNSTERKWLQKKLYRLHKLIYDENFTALLQKVREEEGWVLFHFYSHYFGNENKWDEENWYLFSPVIANEVEKFVNMKFFHSDYTVNDDYEKFKDFIAGLKGTWIKKHEFNDFDVIEVVELTRNEYFYFKDR